jgi:malate/lactate dehydrogenase
VRAGVFGGAGAVGSATAAALITTGVAGDVLLADADEHLLAVRQMDLALLAGTHGARAEAVPAARLAEAEVVVMAAGVAHRDGADRRDFAAANLAVLDMLLDVLPAGWPGALVIASNPVDVLVTAAAGRLGPAARVLGYVANDTLRVAQAIAEVRGCTAAEVDVWALGEHGGDLVLLLDRVAIGGTPVTLTETERAEVRDLASGWYGRWQRHRTGRTSMWTTGSGVARLVAALRGRRMSLEPVSVPLHGRYGVPGPVALGVPTLVGRGRTEPVEWELPRADGDRLRRSADEVARAARQPR